MFKGYGFTGESHVITGPYSVYNNTWGHYWFWNHSKPPGPNCWKCRCQQESIECDPEDGYDVVLICDNTMGLTTTTCSYSLTIGTQFSDSMSQGMSIDTTVEAELQAQFWGIFSGSLGVSETTGYDWTQTSD